MLRRTSVILGTALLVATSSLTVAQQPRGQRQGQRPGGQGGFGGGRFGGGVTSLLGSPEVLKELAVTEDQKGLIEDMLKDLRGSEDRTNFQDLRNLSQEERQKRFEEARKQGEERNKKAEDMAKMILEPNQLERLDQLRLQREGVAALERSEVAAKLGLTQEQRDKIGKIREELRPEPDGFSNQRNASQEERQKAFAAARERREKANAAILAVLTPQQKESWEKMQGKKFDFPQPGGGGGEGRGRPGQDRGARGGATQG